MSGYLAGSAGDYRPVAEVYSFTIELGSVLLAEAIDALKAA